MMFRIVRILLLAVLLGAPLAFGSVVPWARAALLVSAFLLLFLWGSGVQQGVLRVAWSRLYLPAGAFLILGLAQYVFHRTHDPVGNARWLFVLITTLIFFFLAGQLMEMGSRRTWRRFGLVVTFYAFRPSPVLHAAIFFQPRLDLLGCEVSRDGLWSVC